MTKRIEEKSPGPEPDAQPPMEAVTADYLRKRQAEQEAIERHLAGPLGRALEKIRPEDAASVRAALERLSSVGRTDEMIVDAMTTSYGGILERAFAAAGLDQEAVMRELRELTGTADEGAFAGVFLAFGRGFRVDREAATGGGQANG